MGSVGAQVRGVRKVKLSSFCEKMGNRRRKVTKTFGGGCDEGCRVLEGLACHPSTPFWHSSQLDVEQQPSKPLRVVTPPFII